MSVQKAWVGEVDATSVDLELYIDGVDSGKSVTLSATNGWKSSVFIAPGLKAGDSILDAGHDYTLVETTTDPHYEYSAEIEHPMLVNGTLTYAGSDSILTGTNTHKSELDITKTVVDNSDNKTADPDQLFTYDVTVTDGKAADGKVAFSIVDANGDVVTADGRVGGATATNGVYSATSAAAMTIKIKAGEKIVFTNLGTGATYSVTEETPAYGYVNTAITNSDGGTATVPTATGTIEQGNTTYAVGYTNTFDSVTLSGDTALKVTKSVTGHDATEAFGFSLTPNADTQAAIDAGKIKVAANALTATSSNGIKKGANEDVNFGDITFYAEGTYTFTADETTTTTAGGWAYDTTTQDITVTVTKDAATGKLVASVEGNDPTFTNAYTAQPVTDVMIPVRKSLSVSEGLTAPDITNKYTFTLAAKTTGAPMPATTTVTNPAADGGIASFGGITYATPGTYAYTVTETGSVPGVSNDSAAASGKTVTVTVTDNNAGQLVASVSSTQDSPLTFTNSYSVGEVKAAISVEKLLDVQNGDNAPDVTNQYTFTLKDANGTTVGTVKSGASGATVDFPEITYSTPGTYTYTVTESGSLDGVTNDDTATKTVSVVVSDNTDGTMSATVNGGNGAVIFTNTYNAASVDVPIPVKKTLSVLSGNNAPNVEGQYTFTLKDANSATVGTVTSGTSGTAVNFDPITYTAPGTYTYTITETGTLAGVTNDAAASTGKTVTVHVADNGTGQLVATINGAGTADDVTNFTNTYRVASTTVAIPVEKVLYVPAGLTGPGDITGKFKFTLAPVGNAPMPGTNVVPCGASGATVSFDGVTYTTPGDYSYKITESGIVSGVTNDAAAASGKTVTIHVTDNGEGQLVATINGDGADDDATVFTNNYVITSVATASIPVEKTLTVPAGLTGPASIAGKFTFTLTAKTAGAPMPTTNTITNPDADGGTDSFSPIIYTAPGTYTYTVTETNTDGVVPGVTNDTTAAKEVTVTVTDSGDGTLHATSSSTADAPLTFTNTYDITTSATATIPVAKTLFVPAGLTGPESIANDFTFTLTAKTAGAPMPEDGGNVVTNPDADGGTASFGEITYDTTGTYVYTVTETGSADGVMNDETSAKDVTVNVTDGGNGQLVATSTSTAENPLTFTNIYSITEPATDFIPVEKILSVPEGLAGPDDVTGDFTFTLTAKTAGAPMPDTSSITNPDAKGGTVTFGEITFDTPGAYTYTVTESNTDGVVPGVTNDTTSAKDVTITVTDSGDGTLHATSTSTADAPLTFTNTYGITTPATASISVDKVLSVPEGLLAASIAGKFTFTLTAKTAGAPMPEAGGDVVTNPDADGGTASFGDIEFTAPGTYTYTVTESGSADGVTNDTTSARDVDVVVTDNGEGTLTAVVNGDEPVTFTNTYDVTPASLTLGVTKTLDVKSGNNAPDISNDFTFTLAAVTAGAPMPAAGDEVVTNPDGNGTEVDFGAISFTAPGDYQYTITESETVKGVTNDAQATRAITIHVADNGDGSLTPSVAVGSQVSSFTNSYSVAPVTLKDGIKLTKALTGANLAAGEFEFTLAAADGTPMPVNTKVTNGSDGSVVFGDITYTAPGTYEYTVTEDNTDKAGYTYDDSTIDVTVVVTDNGDGTMTAATKYGEQTTFSNSYAASGSVTLTAMKTLDGRELKDGQFSFELKDANGTVLQTVKNDAAGSVTFAPIDYTNESIATTTPNEVTKVAVSATVGGTDDAPVAIQLLAGTTPVGDPVTGVTTATYDFGEQDKYDSAGNEITYSVSVNGADAVAATTTDVDPGSTTTYGEKVFAYTISEVNDGKAGYTYDDKAVNVTVTVTDAGNGKIKAVPTYDPSAEFENSYHATGSTGEGDLSGTKVSNGTVAEGQFSFELLDEQGKVLQTVKNAADGSFSFDPITYNETQVGAHKYSIVEVNDGQAGYDYDGHTATATVNVTDNGDGTLAVTTSYGETSREFNNPYKALGTSTQLQAKKVLVGRDLAAGEFDFQLTDAAGTTYTAQNAADGTITFPYVSFDEPGTYTFTASEVAGSEANVTYDGGTFTYTVVVEDVNGQLAVTSVTTNGSADVPTFTNTYTEPVVEKTVVKVPDTGDNSGVGVLAALVAGAAAVAAGSIARRRDQD